MYLFGLVACLLGNVLIGLGQTLQKYALNRMHNGAGGPGGGQALSDPGQDRLNGPASVTPTSPMTPTTSLSTPLTRRRSPSRLKPFTAVQPTPTKRWQSLHWVFGLVLCYAGELGGNWVGLAYASAAVVAPLGIVSVIVSAWLAERWLHEQIRREQRYGYLWIAAGVLLILSVAPKPPQEPQLPSSQWQHPQLEHGIHSVQTLDQWLHFMATSPFWTVCGMLVAGALFLLYRILVQNRDRLVWHVLVTALFGGVTILCSKAFTVYLKVRYQQSDAPNTTDGTSPNNPVTIILLGTFLLAGCTQEVMKQRALSRYPNSQFQPMFYACFNLVSVLTGVFVFQELPPNQPRMVVEFLAVVAVGMLAIVAGSQRLMLGSHGAGHGTVLKLDNYVPTSLQEVLLAARGNGGTGGGIKSPMAYTTNATHSTNASTTTTTTTTTSLKEPFKWK